MNATASPIGSDLGLQAGLLDQYQLFESLSETEQAAFLDAASEHRHQKGKILYLQNDPAKTVYLIRQGWVKLFRETIEGDEAVMDILTSGHIFGESAIFSDGSYGESAQVIEDTQLVEIPIGVLKDQIAANAQFAMNMMATISRSSRRQSMEIEHLTLQNAPQRIGCFLLRLCRGREQQKTIVLNLPYDKTLIASRLGMQPETFSRALAKLKNETDLAIDGATITITQLGTLIQYCCNACSLSYPCKD